MITPSQHLRGLEIIDRLSDDELIDIATTCSNRGVALNAEMHLRARYPSKLKLKSIGSKKPRKVQAKA